MFRIGLLGASKIAPGAVIAPVRADARFEITAVGARDPARARDYADAHGIPHVAAGYAELVTRDDVDLVYNALPASAHLEWTTAALEAGKAVLCEKPFAMNAAEARQMVQASERTGRLLLEAFHYRFHRVIRESEEIIRSGALGRLRRASAVFKVTIPRQADELRWRRELGGGGLMDLGCYPLHALRTLIGAEPVIQSAAGRFDGGVDVEMEGRLAFPGDVTAEIGCAMTSPSPIASLQVEGDRGRLDILNFVAPQLRCRFTTTIDGIEEERPTDGPSTYQAQLSHLADVLDGRAEPMTGGRDAIANMTAIDAIYAAAGRD